MADASKLVQLSKERAAIICADYYQDLVFTYPKVKAEVFYTLEDRLARIADEFIGLDRNQSGDLDFHEVQEGLNKLKGKEVPAEQVKQLLSMVDDDNTGTLRLREYLDLRMILDQIIPSPLPVKRVTKSPAPSRRQLGAAQQRKRGYIKLQAWIEPSNTLKVMIERACNLVAADVLGKADPFVKMYLQPDPTKATKKKTDVVKKSLDPMWNQSFSWNLPTTSAAASSLRLEITVVDRDLFSRREVMGRLSFGLDEIRAAPNSRIDGWYILLDENQGSQFNFPGAPVAVAALPAPQKLVDMAFTNLKTVIRPPPPAAPKPVLPKREDFEIVKALCAGSIAGSCRFLARHKNKRLYALDVIPKEAVKDSGPLHVVLSARHALAAASGSDFLCHMYGTFQSTGNLYFALDYYPGGALYSLQARLPDKVFTVGAAAFYAAEIILGLDYLHSLKVAFLALSPFTVLLDARGHVRLADFVFAVDLAASPGNRFTPTAHTLTLDPYYRMPELVRNEPLGVEADWWTLGVMLIELLKNVTLFSSTNSNPNAQEAELNDQILHKPLAFPELDGATADLLVKLLDRNPLSRLGSDSAGGVVGLKSHSFFANARIDWGSIGALAVPPPHTPAASAPESAANYEPMATVLPGEAAPSCKQELFATFDLALQTIPE